MNQTNNTIQFSQFAAVSKDSDEVLGKILYYTLSSILIDREVLARLCDTVDFPYKPIRRSSLADAFRSATGDIYHRLVVKDAGVPQIINVYCRDNRGPKGIISRELVKETLHEDTNEYKKLANISLDRGSGVFSYNVAKQAQETALKQTVLLMRDLGVAREEAVRQLAKRYDLLQNDAETAVRQYWTI